MFRALKQYWQLFIGLLLGGAVVLAVLWAPQYFRPEVCPYPFVNPTRCEPQVAFKNPEYGLVEQQLVGYIAQQKHNGVAQASVYFRDLRNGPSFSISAKMAYIGASLLKLPVLLEYLKEAEENPQILDEEIIASVVPTTTNQGLPVNQTVQNGQRYSVRELLQRMVQYSDNNSRASLVNYYQSRHPQGRIILDTLENIGITNLKTDAEGTHITVADTASIFRILYNAAYLNPEQSQQALHWLSESRYDDGIAHAIPAHVPVANKYGIYNTQTSKELHDCGIIFYPNHPYVLCVMTEGQSIAALQDTIAHISKVVYDEVAERFPQ